MTRYQLSIRCGNNTTTHGRGDANDEEEDGLYDEWPQRIGVKRPRLVSPPEGLAFYRTRHFILPSIKVPYATSRSLQ